VILPTDPTELQNCVRWIIERCLSSRDERERTYQWREKYYLFGTQGYEQAKYNKIESHLDLVTAFLYSPEHAFFHVAAPSNADDLDVLKATALQDDFNEDFQACGISDVVVSVIPWALTYDTMIIGQGWNRDKNEWYAYAIPPHNFGVYRESIPDLDSQQAFVHTYFLDYQTAAGKLMLAGRESEIDQLKVSYTDSINPFPEMLQRMIVTGTGGSNLAGTIFGQVNPDYSPSATYQPKSAVPVVRFNELWVWDDSTKDYRVFHVLEPDIIIGDSMDTIAAFQTASRNVRYLFDNIRKMGLEPSRSNPFYPREHPFAKIQPYGKWNYFWGKAHIDSIIPLQEWMLERLDQIADMLERQAYPARVGSGFMGLTEEKMAAFGGADTYVFDQLPNAKIEELRPEMPPDLFKEYNEISSLFLEASGLTEVMQGHSEKGVRSHQHATQLNKTGSGRIKKAALALEPAVVKIGHVGLQLKRAHDDQELTTEEDDDGRKHKFLPADMKDVKMRVDGHSHSPLFGDEAREMAVSFIKVRAIDQADFIRMMNPPEKDRLLHNLRRRQKRQQKMLQQHPEMAQGQHAAGGKKR
jgi:hypothetical protein